MNKSYIAVFDSGVGGLNILESLVKEFPHENFIYLADEEFFPYGVKTKEQLENRITKIAKKLSEMNVKTIIIACNTASANSHHLKNIISTNVIEIITATAHYALEVSDTKKIGVWATNATILSNKYQEALSNALSCYPVKASDLVELIESNLLEDTKPLVNEHLNEIQDADSLILGCTHFPLLKDIIKEINPTLKLISSNIPVNVALKKYLDEFDLHNNNTNQIINLYTTSVNGLLCEKVKRFGITASRIDYLEIK